MKKTILKSGIALFLAVSLLLGSCGGMFDQKPGKTGTATGIDGELRNLGAFSQPLEKVTASVYGPIAAGDPNYPDRPPNYDGVPNTEAYKVVAAPGYDELMLLAPTSDVMWLGAIMDGNTITTGEYRPITVNRGPLTFSISVPMGTQARTVPVASLSAVRVATSEIVTSAVLQAPPADVKFSKEFVYSENQTQVALGANFKYGAVSVKTGFDFSKTNIKSRMIVKYLQPYYTLDMDIPQDPSDLFAPETEMADLRNQITGSTSPIVISSIKYGRMAIFTIESESSENDLKFSIEAALNFGLAKAGATFSTEQRNVLKNSSVKVFVYGGDSGTAAEMVLTGDIDNQFVNWIKEDGNLTSLSPSLPLAYTMRYLKDWSVARVVLATEYWQRVIPGQGQAPVYPKYGLVKIDSADMRNTATITYFSTGGGEQTVTGTLYLDLVIEKGYDNIGFCGSTSGVASCGPTGASAINNIPVNRFVSFNEGLPLDNAYVLISIAPRFTYQTPSFLNTAYGTAFSQKIYLNEFNTEVAKQIIVPITGFPVGLFNPGAILYARINIAAMNP